MALPARLIEPLVAVCVAAGLALWALDPAWRDPGAWLVGNWVHPDCLSNHWLLQWVAERVSSGESFLHNPAYYWPVGDDPVRAGNGAEGFLYLPFHLLLGGWPTAVPAYLVAVLTLNGMAGWLAGRAAGAGPWASLLPLSLMGCSPFVFRELSAGRFTQASVGWLGLFLAAWLWLLRRPGAGRALLAAAALALTSFFYWFYGLFGVLAGGLLLAARGVTGLRSMGPRTLAVFTGSFLVLIGPWAWVFASGWGDIVGVAEVSTFPHPEALQEASWPQLPVSVSDGRFIGQAMGALGLLSCLCGALLAVVKTRRDPVLRGLLVVALVALALMVGPLGDLAPYTHLYGLAEPLQRFWWPSRHVVLLHLSAGALGAVALTWLGGWLRARRPARAGLIGWAAAVGAVCLALSQPALLAAQGVPPHPRLTPIVLPPPAYPQLAERGGSVLIEPPLAPEAAGTQQHLVYQVWHGKQLLSGHALWVDRVRPDGWDRFVADNSFLSGLQAFERGELGPRFAFEDVDLQALIDRDVRWIGLNREYFALGLRELRKAYPGLLRQLFGAEVISEDDVRIWDMREWNGRTDVAVADLSWPADLPKAGPEQPLSDRRAKSAVFAPEDRRTGR